MFASNIQFLRMLGHEKQYVTWAVINDIRGSIVSCTAVCQRPASPLSQRATPASGCCLDAVLYCAVLYCAPCLWLLCWIHPSYRRPHKTLQNRMHSARLKMWSELLLLCSVQCSVCFVQFAVWSVQFSLFSVQCSIYSVQCAQSHYAQRHGGSTDKEQNHECSLVAKTECSTVQCSMLEEEIFFWAQA